MRLEDQVALITGGGKGIGRAIALAFAREGASIALCGRNRNPMEKVAEELTRLGAQSVIISCDVSREDEVAQMVDATAERFGGLTILVNNAGGTGPTAPVAQVTLRDWNETLETNLTGAFLCSRAALKYMIPRRRGKIINIASIAGTMAYPLRAPYSVSKWGMLGLNRTLAAELGEFNIQVNAICPGPVRGERMQNVINRRAAELGQSSEEVAQHYVSSTALKKFVDPEHIAEQALLLASASGDSTTGQVFTIDCGFAL
ncbi:MAG: SDR family oxidoreductase [Acidobacteriia bacterium]|nr:SDR family oxidoreductase [Terriglobia bacterium]